MNEMEIKYMDVRQRSIVKVLQHIFLKPTSRYLIYVINENKTYILYEDAEDMRLHPYDKWISVLRRKLTMSLIKIWYSLMKFVRTNKIV